MRYFFSFLLALMLGIPAFAQQDSVRITHQDSINTGLKYLLEDRRLSFETTDAINGLYNFKFDVADDEFRFLEAKYPEHPLPTFLRGLLLWWKIVPNEEADESQDEPFFATMDRTISKAEKLLNRNENNLEAAFFLSAAYGFKGRLNADRHNWRRATVDGRNALKYLEMSHGKEQFSPEFLFGDALFNYYRVYIHDNFPLLRPVLAFFPKGDKQLGLQQLKTVTRNSFYTRTEAQTYLMRIYANEESNASEAYPIAEYLAKTFPDNSYFQRYKARLAYVTGRMSDCNQVSQDIYQKVKAGQVGYSFEDLRNSAFFLGYYNFTRAMTPEQKEISLSYFTEAVDAAHKVNAVESGYTLSSMYYAGLLEDQLGRRERAIYWMKKCDDEAPKESSTGKDAKAWLKKNKVKTGWWPF